MILKVNILASREDLVHLDAILAVSDTTQPFGIRKRAILETFYSSAIRASELSTVSLHDIDRDRKLLVIGHGKGDKPRWSPISTTAFAWIDRRINEVRPANARSISGSYLFLGQRKPANDATLPPCHTRSLAKNV
ncbi:tyrosine-type recombinase/integrase [Rhodopirellula sp. JC639]|uniref:tyrosine-type recombinase/integrase n=1 Tax=Stieleria mannarensis TaxID=2755585 RepID=UPI0016044E19|nr:tyrosine-type recombinase/integrase [Rhodopirellula sp. JC639]